MKRDTRGATALEYALLAAIIGGALITSYTTMAGSLSHAFSIMGNALTAAASGS